MNRRVRARTHGGVGGRRSQQLRLLPDGDTCFASILPLSDQQYLVYNYTSPLDDPELAWNDGQFGETYIYRVTLTMP